MQIREFSSLGLTVKLNVPSTVEEFDQLAKRQGACLEESINNVAYRGSLAEFRDVLLHGREAVAADPAKGIEAVSAIDGIEQITGIERVTKPSGKKRKVTGPDGKETEEDILVYADPTRTEGDYMDYVCAQKGWTTPELRKANLQALADIVSAQLVFDPSATERKPSGPKKLPAAFKQAAERLFANNNVEKALGRIAAESKVEVKFEQEPAQDAPEFAAVRAKNIEALGWAIKANEAWKQEQALLSYA